MNGVAAITRVRLISAEPERLAQAYEAALGFVAMGRTKYGGESFGRLLGLPGAKGAGVLLRMGREEIELLAVEPPGRPYPTPARANDRFFQHMAIVTSDMAESIERLSACPCFTAISRYGAQHLSARSGGVTAFKFRDPEGHPLELIAFPPEHVPPPWRDGGSGPMGIDHSAIVVGDSLRSIAFYQKLGFAIGQRSQNHGPAQDHLDGLDPARVEVVALNAAFSPPHLELLCYETPGAQRCWDCNDIAATSLRMSVNAGAALVNLERNFAEALVSPGIVTDDQGKAQLLMRDPDGHLLWLTQA